MTSYYRNNKEKWKAYGARSRAKNREARRAYDKKWREEHPDYEKNKRRNNIQFKLTVNLRSRLNRAILANTKAGSSVKDLGCSIAELKLHLEAQFQPGMTWDNWTTDGWHIDHITPLSKFDLTDREQFLKACHFSNLQPLWAKDNLNKAAQ